MTVKIPSWEKSTRQRMLLETLSGAGVEQVNKQLQEFKGRTVVLKADGSVLEKPDAFEGLAEDAALLRRAGARVLIVHGGHRQAESLQRRLRIRPSPEAGAAADRGRLRVSQMTFGSFGSSLVCALRAQGVPAIGISGIDGGLISVTGEPAREIASVDPSTLRLLLDAGFIPVIAPLAADAGGRMALLDADAVAERVACALGADDFVIVSEDASELGSAKSQELRRVGQVDLAELPRLLAAAGASPRLESKLRACGRAVASGIERAYLLQGLKAGSILTEILTGVGCGLLLRGGAGGSGRRI